LELGVFAVTKDADVGVERLSYEQTADGRMATDAAQLEDKEFTEVKTRTVSTLTGLLMEGVVPV
jgi:hypothetical protein